MRNTYTSGSIIGNRELIELVGKTAGGSKIWSWKCTFCGTTGKPMNTSLLARCNRLHSTPKCCNKGYRNRQYIGTDILSQDYVTRVRRGALSRGYSFTVTFEYLELLLVDQHFRCALSGVDITPPGRGRGQFSASLDRIDSSLGYVEGNVQWIHKRVNQMKSDMTEQEFIGLCRSIAANATYL